MKRWVLKLSIDEEAQLKLCVFEIQTLNFEFSKKNLEPTGLTNTTKSVPSQSGSIAIGKCV